eukprot:1227169-Lingulodinium_polyedra.AAC.1
MATVGRGKSLGTARPNSGVSERAYSRPRRPVTRGGHRPRGSYVRFGRTAWSSCLRQTLMA